MAEGPDGGVWAWVMVGALFVSSGFVFGLMRSLGVFFVEFVQYFEESAQAISWITSIAVAAQQFFSPMGAALCNAYDARIVVMTGGCLAGLGFILASQATCLAHLYLTMGVITGLGWGLVFTPMVVSVMGYFTRRSALALGLGFSSIGLSSFIFNPLFQLLVEKYAWRGALLIMGGLSLNIVPCGALIRRQKQSKAPAKVGKLSVFVERPFLTFCAAITLFNAGYFVPYVHLVALSRHVGFSEYQAAFIMSVTGATDILGRVVSGWSAARGCMRMVHILILWTSLTGVFIILLPLSSMSGSYPVLLTVSLLYGFCGGALTSVVFPVVPQIVGVERMMGASGLVQLIESIGGLLGAPLSGFLKDVTGNYLASFVVAGSFLLLGCLILTTLPRFFQCRDPPPSSETFLG
uniref:Monocarboxylate transporter 13 n=1 Tax=Myripristis murdjan TaxID=586833 RepID=A0A667ZE13_9TELE